MADISAIKALDGVTYSIKDSEAREHLVPTGGTTGQVLTKTSSGYEWDDATGGGNVDTVNNIQPDANKNVQTVVELTQAQYDALVSPDPNVVYYITDGSTSYPTADEVRYEEGVSVADALDELNAGLITESNGITYTKTGSMRKMDFAWATWSDVVSLYNGLPSADKIHTGGVINTILRSSDTFQGMSFGYIGINTSSIYGEYLSTYNGGASAVHALGNTDKLRGTITWYIF